MTKEQLIATIKEKRSFLCVGLDTDIRRIPKKFLAFEDPVLAFNKTIIEITAPYAVAFKPNTAFYESTGSKGWKTLEDTFAAMPDDVLKIADAKRGDIGNTSNHYAESVFNVLGADAITVAPYMGSDSVQPFLDWKNKWTIVLAVTSNDGSSDFQTLKLENGNSLYSEVVKKASSWGSSDQLMFVVGATSGKHIGEMRSLAPDHFFLVPGVGVQGGSIEEVARHGLSDECGLLVNASRSILYADNSLKFEGAVESVCQNLQKQMEEALVQKGII